MVQLTCGRKNTSPQRLLVGLIAMGKLTDIIGLLH